MSRLRRAGRAEFAGAASPAGFSWEEEEDFRHRRGREKGIVLPIGPPILAAGAREKMKMGIAHFGKEG